jgi:DNA-binding PadR family transcriptional regulator
MKRWMKHTAMVPKGFLRYELLKKISAKPMSGSEIMSELENETDGYWKPSPGSIYPLLAWLQDQKYIKEAPQAEPGIRRYALTEEGKVFLETETKSREEIDKHLEHFGRVWYGHHREHAGETGKAARDLFKAIRDLHHELRKEHPKELLEGTKKDLEEASKQIQDITRKLRSGAGQG